VTSKILIFLAVVIALLAACKPAGIEYVKYETEEAVPRISAADAKKEVDAGNAVLVDSRDAGAFNFERLPGAVNIQAGATPDKFSQLPKGKKIIVYCS
jgi:hypothetical protein